MNPNDDPGRSSGDFCGVCGEEILVSRDYPHPYYHENKPMCYACATKEGDGRVAEYFHREYMRTHKEAV